MRRRIAITLAVLLLAGAFPLTHAYAEAAARLIVTRVVPRYPDLARPMRLEGSVKISVLVAPNGTVKSMSALGGNPLLLRSAQEAVIKWKWAPASQETTEVIELHFRPD